jgi:hypothetical protein
LFMGVRPDFVPFWKIFRDAVRAIFPSEVTMLWLLAGLACEDRLGFDAVSLYPTYGWADGCTSIRMGGHGFTDAFKAKIGGNDVTGITDPDPTEYPLDQGFEKFGFSPAGDPGFADYSATDAGETVTVTNAFYYLACPSATYVESVTYADGAITISGCGFDAAGTQAYLVVKGKLPVKGQPTFSLSADCGTAVVSFTPGAGAPPGVYQLYLSTDGGTTFIPDPNCVDKDTADTAGACPTAPIVTIKGGA